MTSWSSTCRERSATNFLICSATNLLEIYDVTDMASRFPKSTPATEHVATVRPYASSPTGTQLTSCRDALEQCEGRARVSTRKNSVIFSAHLFRPSFRRLRTQVNLHRCGQASDQAYAVRHVFKPYAHRHALRQAHPGEDGVDHGKTLLVRLRV